MLSRDLELALIKAIKEAKIHRHEYVTVEHMLYGLLHDDLASHIITSCGGNNDNLKERLERFFNGGMPVLKEGMSEPAQTVAFNRVLQRAVSHVQSCGKKQVDTGDVLVAIFNEQDSHAVYFLGTEGVGRMEVVEYISHSLPEHMRTTPHKQPAPGVGRPKKTEEKSPSILPPPSTHIPAYSAELRSTSINSKQPCQASCQGSTCHTRQRLQKPPLGLLACTHSTILLSFWLMGSFFYFLNNQKTRESSTLITIEVPSGK
jgi:ATP-dependent Clp protease ATP-binding subunit ClpA